MRSTPTPCGEGNKRPQWGRWGCWFVLNRVHIVNEETNVLSVRTVIGRAQIE